MVYELNREQFNAVIALPDAKRFHHFISRIVDWEEVWGLNSESGWAMVESGGKICVPFWPHPKYSECFLNSIGNDYKPEAISLDHFIQKWLPGLEQDRKHLAIFPNKKMKGIVVESNKVKLAIHEELEQY